MGLGAAVLALAAVALALPAAANAAAPTGLTVQLQEPHVLFVQWTLPAGTDSHLIEIATSAPNADGTFTTADVVVSDLLAPADTSYTSQLLPAGSYWVHVSGTDTGCVPPCVDAFSDAAPITIVAPPAPALESVGQTGRLATATWSLDPMLENDYIEIATSPETYPEGDFLVENVVLSDLLDPGVTTYTAQDPLPAGVYYVHLAAYEPSCPFICADLFSNVVPLGVPPDPEPHPPFTSPLPKPKPDTVTDFSAIRCASTQKAGNLVVQASMLEAGTITVAGTVSVPNIAKVFKLQAVSVNVRAYQVVKIAVKLPRKALRGAKRALKRHRTVRVRLTISARDGLGNTKSEKRGIRLKR
jgi:hypothetical protein